MAAVREETYTPFSLDAFGLRLIAMVCMFADHLWATTALQAAWLSWIGRLAFPIFAFLLTEGYFHTGNLRRYALRLLLLAVVTEVPFDLIYGGSPLYPFHQNAVWTLLIGFAAIHLNERAKRTGRWLLRAVTAVLTVLLGYLVGMVTMVDYYGAGVLTVLLFYFLRGRRWYCLLLQIAGMWVLHAELLGGQFYPIVLFGIPFELAKQSLALLALIPIWLYDGRLGLHTKAVRWISYAFYPAHLVLLYLWMRLF